MKIIFNIYYGVRSIFCNHMFMSKNIGSITHPGLKVYECEKCYKLHSYMDLRVEEQFKYRKLR